MNRTRKGFTLIELLTVVVIIIILMGLGFAGANMAITGAKKTRAKVEVRDIAKAWQVYWNYFGVWPFGNVEKDMDEKAVQELQGKSSETTGNKTYVLMDIGAARSEGLKDPWGTPYRVNFNSDSNQTAQVENYETVVFLPNRLRYKYE